MQILNGIVWTLVVVIFFWHRRENSMAKRQQELFKYQDTLINAYNDLAKVVQNQHEYIESLKKANAFSTGKLNEFAHLLAELPDHVPARLTIEERSEARSAAVVMFQKLEDILNKMDPNSPEAKELKEILK